MAFSQPFTQLSIEIWEDVDLWLPVNELYSDFHKDTEDLVVVSKKEKWCYLCPLMRLDKHLGGTKHVYNVRFSPSHSNAYQYEVFAHINMIHCEIDFSVKALMFTLKGTDKSHQSTVSYLAIVRCEGTSFYPYSSVLVDILPKPSRNRGPQVEI